jgi:hypothetical protein
MSPVLGVVIVAVGAGLVAGGTLRAFEVLHLHWWGLAVVGLVLQAAPVPNLPLLSARGDATVVLIASYLLLLLVIVLNRRIPAAPAMALGLILNLAVVGANAGMPVSADAIQAAGGSVGTASGVDSAKHHLMTEDDVLTLLADVIPIPPPIAAVLSIGDVFLYGGVFWFVVQVMRGPSQANPRPLAMWFPSYRGKHAPEHWRLASRDRANHAAADRPGTER